MAKKTKNIKQKGYYNKFNKDFKNGPHQKKKNLKRIEREINVYVLIIYVVFFFGRKKYWGNKLDLIKVGTQVGKGAEQKGQR